jgi:hypothetical protein
MKTVTAEAQDLTTLLIADNEAPCRALLSEIRHSFKNLNVTEKSRTIGGDTRLVPVLQ